MKKIHKTIAGWGNYPCHVSKVLRPNSLFNCKLNIRESESLIARGMGRSYGDSANADIVLQANCLGQNIVLDSKSGLLTVESGVMLRDIIRISVPKKWFLPVTPGTSFATVGGAIASDVHGKNHHIAGTFCKHVISISILLGTGEVVDTSPTEMPDLFYSTCGGMGLTGVILAATIQLAPIKSCFISEKTVKIKTLEDALEQFEINSHSSYSVGWVDCSSKRSQLGNSVIKLGEHFDNGKFNFKIMDPLTIPIKPFSFLLSSVAVRLFNKLYYIRSAQNKIRILQMFSYFYPLDSVAKWNKLYGKNGFLQYQFVLPKIDGVKNMRKIFNKISQSGISSFLTVLKKFGPANQNLLSFPLEGYTLALDFKISTDTIVLLHQLDDLIADMGGRIYLSKDAVMKKTTFKKTYPRWEEFEKVREKYGAIGKFSSAQSKRIGLM